MQAGLTVARTLFAEPYLSIDSPHEGCCCTAFTTGLTVGITFRRAKKVAQGESSMWGDYHLLELALLIQRVGDGGPDLRSSLRKRRTKAVSSKLIHPAPPVRTVTAVPPV